MTLNDMPKYYHVQITPKTPALSGKRYETDFDLSFEDLKNRFLAPYRVGKPLVINGRTITMHDLERIRVFESERKVRNLAEIPWNRMPEVTSEFITGPPGSALEATARLDQELRPATDAREVFVVHGRNAAASDALFAFLRAIDLHPLEWSEAVRATGKASPYIGDILNIAFSRAHAVVVVFTPDDEARLREPYRRNDDPPHEVELTGQARPNVLFEAGMAMGRDENRTILVELGNPRPFSDIGGRHTVKLDNSSQRRQELAKRLEAAGCPVNLEGTGWHTAGDFEAAVERLVQVSSDSTPIVEQQPPATDLLQLSEEAKALLIEAAKDKWGTILVIRTTAGVAIKTNGKGFGEMGNRRSEARWEQAVQDLLDQGLVEDRKGKGEVFEVTHKGFDIADSLGTSPQSNREV